MGVQYCNVDNEGKGVGYHLERFMRTRLFCIWRWSNFKDRTVELDV